MRTGPRDANRRRRTATAIVLSLLCLSSLAVSGVAATATTTTIDGADDAQSSIPGDGGVGTPTATQERVPASTTSSAGGDSGGRTGESSTARTSEDAENTSVTNVTLITGQQVRIVRSNGTTNYVLDTETPMHKVETPEGTYIFPVGTNLQKFDPALFNVDLLVSQGYTDAQTDSIPLIVEQGQERVTSTSGDGISATGVTTGSRLESVDAVTATVSKASAGAAYEDLASSDDVSAVYLDKKLHVNLDTAATRVNATDARQKYNVTGENVTVAVLDTGVDATHPDLDDAVVTQVDFSGDGTGDRYGHGTHVAGIIAGDGTASNGTFVGMAPDASIMSVKVLGDDGYGKTSDIINGIEFAESNGADIISMSLGGPVQKNDPLTEATNKAARNVTVVVAAGNSGSDRFTIGSPGNAKRVITVGASNDSGGIASFSSRGPSPLNFRVKPDLVAPGVDIASAEAGTNGYVNFSGTSMATPVVSGIAALVEQKRDPSPRRMKTLLASTSDRLNEGGPYVEGSGEVNASAALGASLFVGNASLDYGVLGSDTTKSRVVSVTNNGSSTRNVSVAATVTNRDTGTTYDTKTNVSSLSLAPGETAYVELTINTSKPDGLYSGYLSIGNRTVTFGYVDGARRITIDKQALSGGDSNVSYDLVFLRSEFTSPSRWTVSGSITNGNATFVVLDGNYTLTTTGVAEGTGATVLMQERIQVDETNTSFVVDESNTARHDIDTTGINNGDPLTMLEYEASIEHDGLSFTMYRGNPPAAAPVARFSTGTAVNGSIETVLVPSSAVPSSDSHFDTPRAYHLVYKTIGVSGSKTFTPTESGLASARYDFYRSTPSETYSLAHFGSSTKGRNWGDFSGIWELRDSRNTTVYLTNNSRYAPSLEDFSPRWNLFGRYLSVDSTDDRFYATMDEQPHFAWVDTWFVDEKSDGTAAFWFDANARVEQPPVRLGDDDGSGTTYLRVVQNGSVVAEQNPSYGGDVFYDDDVVQPGTTFNLTAVSTQSNRKLSTTIISRWHFEYQPGSDNRPPVVTEISPKNLSLNTGVPNGNVTVNVTVAESNTIDDVTIAWANQSVDTAPFGSDVTTIDANWTTSGTPTKVASSGDYATYQVTFDVGDYTGPIHLAIRARDGAGHATTATTFDAFHVGKHTGDEAPAPVSGSISGQVVSEAGTELSGEVVAANWKKDVFRFATTTDGNFTISFDGTPTVSLVYLQTDPDTGRLAPRDGIVDIYRLGEVNVTGDERVGNLTAPSGSVLNITVVDESGAGVNSSFVTIFPNATGGTVDSSGWGEPTLADGKFRFEPNETYPPGVEVSGVVNVSVYPPDSQSRFIDRRYLRNLTITQDRNITVTLDEKNTDAPLDLTANKSNVAVNDTVRFELRRTDTGNLTSGTITLGDRGTYTVGEDGVLNVTVTEPGDVNVTATKPDTVSADFSSDTLSLSVSDPAVLDATYEVVDTTILTTEAIRANVTVQNTGGTVGSMTLNLTVNGTVEATETVTVDPESSTTTTLTARVDTAGDYNVTVNDLNATIVRVERASNPDADVTIDSPADGAATNATTMTVDYSLVNTSTGIQDVRYRVDGGSWSTVSNGLSTTSVDLDLSTLSEGDHEFSLALQDNVGNIIATTTQTVTIDRNNPSVNASASRTTAISPSTPTTISVSVSDATQVGGSTTISVVAEDGTVVTRTDVTDRVADGTANLTWDATSGGSPVASGTYTIRVESADAAGNVQTATIDVTVDTTAPSTDIADISGGIERSGTYFLNESTALNVTGNATDAESGIQTVRVTLVSQATSYSFTRTANVSGGTYSVTLDPTDAPNGQYRVQVAAVDGANNTATATNTTTIVYDTTQPTLGAGIQQVNATWGRVVVTADETLASPPNATVELPGSTKTVTLEANGTNRYTGEFKFGADGTYNVSVSGRDRAGNAATATSTASINTSIEVVDNVVRIDNERTGVYLELHTKDNVSDAFAALTASNSPIATLTAKLNGVGFLEGSLGPKLSENLTSAEIGIPVNDSKLPPGRDPADVQIRHFNETTKSWEVVGTTTVESVTIDGVTRDYYVLNVTHFSTYGAVTADDVPPTFSGTTLTPDADTSPYPYETETVDAVFEYDDAETGINTSAVTVYVDGTKSSSLSSVTTDVTVSDVTVHVSGLTGSGDHTITVEAVDEAGNTQTNSTSFTVTQDTSAPTLDTDLSNSTTYPYGTDSVTARVNYSDDLSGVDRSTVTVTVDGNDVTDAAIVDSDYVSYTLSDPAAGDHTITVSATDADGNTETLTRTVTVEADTAAPTVSDTTFSPTPDATGDPVTFQYGTDSVTTSLDIADDASGVDASAIRVSFGRNGTFTDVTSGALVTDSTVEFTAYDLDSDTNYTLRATLTDAAGNTRTVERTFTLADAAAPRFGSPSLSPVNDNGDITAGADAPVLEIPVSDSDNDVVESGLEATVDGEPVSDITLESGTIVVTLPALDAGDHTVTVTATDAAGKTTTRSYDVTVAAASSGGGGGSSGGGGGGGGGSLGPRTDVVPAATGVEVQMDDVFIGSDVSVDLAGKPVGTPPTVTLRDIAFTATKDIESASMTVSATNSPPAGVSKPDGTAVVTYLEIEHPEFGNDAVRGTVITFRVSKQLLKDRGVEPNDVTLYRYSDGSWTAQDTWHTTNEFGKHVIEAQVNGLSYFALGLDGAKPAGTGSSDLSISGVSTNVSTLGVGETVAVTATVTNDRSQSVNADIPLSVDGETVTTRTVSLDAGESKTISFTYQFSEQGSYEVAVGNTVAGTVTVEPAEQSGDGTGAENAGSDGSGDDASETTSTGMPGFGGLTALLAALLALLSLAFVRRRAD